MEIYFSLFFVALLGLMILIITGKYVGIWFQALVSGTRIPLLSIIGMSMRKIPPRIIVNARINLSKAGLKEISTEDLETHYLAGGHIQDVVLAMIAAEKANISLDWKRATAIDLAGRNIRDAVQTSVNPKVIDVPSHGGDNSGVAKNGIMIHVRARVTVRTNIAQLVGGATEETIIARVGEGIVSAIGSAETHYQVLEAPQKISKEVLGRGLDASTAFTILSIDIVEMRLGKNIGAELQTDQANANKVIAQAAAETRRAAAVAAEQENIAEIKRMESKVIEAQAQVPLAIAEAFRQGHLDIMGYMKYKNIESDTLMRGSIAKPDEPEKK